MANQILVGAGGDKIGPLNLPNKNCTVTAQLKLNGATGVSLAPQVRLSSAFPWISIKCKDPAADAMVTALTTDGQIGWVENVGYNEIQWLQTGVVAVAAADVAISISPDSGQ